MKDIYLAGGCFWGVSEFFSRIEGVVISEVGYANGITTNPTYEQVCTGTTGFAEVCFVRFDEEKVSLSEILTKFWSVINPTTLEKQANDVGNQYRSGIYYTTSDDIDAIFVSLKEEQKKYDKPIVTEVLPLKNYFKAEEYHQDYLKKNPNGYCHIKF